MAICAANTVIVPIVTIFFYKRGELGTEKQEKRFGVAFSHLNYEVRDYWALLYPLFSNLRLMLVVYVTIYMGDYLVC